MTRRYGSQSMTAPLRRVLVRRPGPEFAVDDAAKWNYGARPVLSAAQREHDDLVDILRQAGAEVIYHDAPLPEHADSIFTHDPAIVTAQGAIILGMGKELRCGEEAAMAAQLTARGIPVHYRLQGEARAEGGDLLWIDRNTLAAGQGFRTNAAGLAQLREALLGQDVEVVPVPLPYHQGPDACLHLMSLISVLDADLAVVYPPLLPVPFWQFLTARGFRLIEVPEREFHTLGANVLALAPRHCVMLENNPLTRQRLEAAGCRVHTYRGNEISLKAEGGATCLTRPIWRADAHDAG